MRSKTSLYNPGLGKSLLRRCWPLWVLWLGLLILSFTMNTASEIAGILKHGSVNAAVDLRSSILNQGIETAWFAVILCPVAVLLMFSFLYTSRGSGMIAALPVKRESVFFTCYVTGLVPLLLAEVIAAVITVLVCGSSGLLNNADVWEWLWIAASGTTAFYGIAVFCAMLTGSFVIMPLAYLALNVAPYLAHAGIGSTLEALLYGYGFRESRLFTALSPILGLYTVSVETLYADNAGIVRNNFGLLGYYLIAGLVLSVFALLLFRKRRMECAGDIVAINILKPVFKYCLALAGACSFAPLMNAMFFDNTLNGSLAGILTIVSLLVGGFIGYFAAEMLLGKTVKVFRGHWKGFALFSLTLLIIAVCMETDIFGYEKNVPDSAEVEAVFMDYSGETVFKEPENIKKVTELHRRIIDSKEVNEGPSYEYDILGLSYALKNGGTVSRTYRINRYIPDSDEINPDLYALEDVINVPEAIRSRAELPVGCNLENADRCMIYGYYLLPDGTQQEQHHELTKEQAKDFYENCILPDAEDGHMLRIWPVQEDEYHKARLTLYADYEFSPDKDSPRRRKEFVLYSDAERCCKWIEDNTSLVLQTYEDVGNIEEAPVHTFVY